MHLVFSVDANFRDYAAVAIHTALSQTPECTDVHVLHRPRDGDALAALARLPAQLGRRGHFHAVDPSRFAGLPVTDHVSIATYYRLAIASLLPESVERVIYLDADLIVLDSLLALWQTPSHPSGVAAVPEPSPRSAELGLPPQTPYFNAGVLVIDLGRWRQIGAQDRLMQLASSNADRLKFWDQDVLALYLGGDFEKLSPRWNLNHRYFFAKPPLPMPAQQPAVVHFSGSGLKPWDVGIGHPFHDAYWSAAAAVRRHGFFVHDPNRSPRRNRFRRWEASLHEFRARLSGAGRRAA